MGVYDVLLIFRKKDDGSKTVDVTIRQTKKGKSIKDALEFEGDIYDNDPNYWEFYNGQQISVYHRREKNVYVNKEQQSVIPIEIGQRLEEIVQKILNSKNETIQIDNIN